ncbi:hypothetical protein [Nocardioides solisilvae]|uniref:hypothetical protein n=1 Tax=Nocardioides solisilvae TaxID=1542435 RepID=UPI0013A59433|nr:hypothetical protein [Nocardioides solisilvae]
MSAELAVLDSQLGVLERACPVEAWSRHWDRVRESVLHAADEQAPRAPDPGDDGLA